MPENEKVEVPWTEDQVNSLNKYQSAGVMHPFTSRKNSGIILIATRNGWVERLGGPVVQTWAHKFMADWTWKGNLVNVQNLAELPGMIDLFRADTVEVIISQDKTKLWVNVDGVCRFRAYRIKQVHVDGV